MSANSAVTVLRSPSSSSDEPLSVAPRTLGADPGGDEAAAAPTPFVNGVPHLPQKSEVGGFSALHFAHCFASAVPHFAQKLLVGELFVPHFAQRIATTFPRADAQVSRQDAPIDRREPGQAARPAERADRDRGRAPTRLRPHTDRRSDRVSLVEDLSRRDLTWLREQVELAHSNSVASRKSHTDLPCLIETKLAEGLIQNSQEFYLRGLLVRSEVQPQTHGQTTAEIIQESKAIGSRLRDKIRSATN
jgi:hypothetical protein